MVAVVVPFVRFTHSSPYSDTPSLPKAKWGLVKMLCLKLLKSYSITYSLCRNFTFLLKYSDE